MYIINQKKSIIINTDFVSHFSICDKEDTYLIMCSHTDDPKPVTIGAYPCRKDAQAVLEEIYAALVHDYKSYDVPEKRFFEETAKVMDSRTKRKGGS